MLVKKDKRDACPTMYNQLILYEMSELMSDLQVLLIFTFSIQHSQRKLTHELTHILSIQPTFGLVTMGCNPLSFHNATHCLFSYSR